MTYKKLADTDVNHLCFCSLILNDRHSHDFMTYFIAGSFFLLVNISISQFSLVRTMDLDSVIKLVCMMLDSN